MRRIHNVPLKLDQLKYSTCDAAHTAKKVRQNFSINVYSMYFDAYKQMVLKALHEVADPDGVFIVVETNFNVLKI